MIIFVNTAVRYIFPKVILHTFFSVLTIYGDVGVGILDYVFGERISVD